MPRAESLLRRGTHGPPLRGTCSVPGEARPDSYPDAGSGSGPALKGGRQCGLGSPVFGTRFPRNTNMGSGKGTRPRKGRLALRPAGQSATSPSSTFFGVSLASGRAGANCASSTPEPRKLSLGCSPRSPVQQQPSAATLPRLQKASGTAGAPLIRPGWVWRNTVTSRERGVGVVPGLRSPPEQQT